MLQKDYTTELIDFVQTLWEGEILNWPTLEAMRITTEEAMWPDLWITNYNIRQIVSMKNEVPYNRSNPEEMSSAIINKTYDRSFIKTFKRVKEADYIKKSRLLWSTTDFLENIQLYIRDYEPRRKVDFTYRQATTPLTKVIALTDLHLWKKWSDLIVRRLDEIVDNIVSSDVTHVDIFCVGDLVETLVQWWMHDWQIEWMWEMYWFDLLMKTVEIFENFLVSISECWISIKFYWLSGNHDRMTKDREWDKSRLWWLVIYELIKRWLENFIDSIEIEIIQDYITTVDIDNVRYIVAHGDMARIPKRKWSDIAWIHWDNTKSHNVILHWHLHNISITEEKAITKIGLPWLAGTDIYATKELDLHSEPAYVEITHNRHWSIDILIKRLAHDND